MDLSPERTRTPLPLLLIFSRIGMQVYGNDWIHMIPPIIQLFNTTIILYP